MSENGLPELPKGWVRTTLGDICAPPQYGWTTSASTTGQLRILRTTDITTGQVDWTSVPFCSIAPKDKGKYLLKDGDIVISRAGSVGFSQLIRNPEEAVFASYLIRFRPLVEPDFVAYFLKSPDYWREISESSIGIAIPNVNATKLKGISLPLPPLPEQHRIVAKIEELFTQLDAGVDALRKAQAQLKRYRQAVLKHAFDGSLTAEWRAAHKAELEPASTLLERIRAERGGKAAPPLDTDGLPVLSEGWVWARIGTLFDVKPGGTPSRKEPTYWQGDIPWVSSGEVANCRIRATRECITALGLENSNAKICPPGTVLLAMIGEGKTRGQSAILDIPATTNQNVAAVLCASTPIRPEYLVHWFIASYAETRGDGSGGMQPALNAGRVQALKIPLASVQEQHQIVVEVERRFSIADEVEKTIGQALKQAERLRQSILKRAFAGRLMPQDPNDEPADRLLQRIRAARAGVGARHSPAAFPRAKRSTAAQTSVGDGLAGNASPLPNPTQGRLL